MVATVSTRSHTRLTHFLVHSLTRPLTHLTHSSHSSHLTSPRLTRSSHLTSPHSLTSLVHLTTQVRAADRPPTQSRRLIGGDPRVLSRNRHPATFGRIADDRSNLRAARLVSAHGNPDKQRSCRGRSRCHAVADFRVEWHGRAAAKLCSRVCGGAIASIRGVTSSNSGGGGAAAVQVIVQVTGAIQPRPRG